MHGHYDMVESLIEKGADPNLEWQSIMFVCILLLVFGGVGRRWQVLDRWSWRAGRLNLDSTRPTFLAGGKHPHSLYSPGCVLSIVLFIQWYLHHHGARQ